MRIFFLLCSFFLLWGCTATQPSSNNDTGTDSSGADAILTVPDQSHDSMDGITESQAECFNFFGAGTGDLPTFDLAVRGSGLEEWNGEMIRIVVDTDGWGDERYGVAQTMIEAGSFIVMMPDTLELDYTGIGIYVDTTLDNTCAPGEPLWNSNTGILTGDMTVDQMFELPGSALEGDCNINGMFDLAVPLPCSP